MDIKHFSGMGLPENGAKSQSQPTPSFKGELSRPSPNSLFLKLFIRPKSWNEDVIFTDIGGPGEKSSKPAPSPYGKSSVPPAPPSPRQRRRRTPYDASSEAVSIEKSSIASNVRAGRHSCRGSAKGSP